MVRGGRGRQGKKACDSVKQYTPEEIAHIKEVVEEAKEEMTKEGKRGIAEYIAACEEEIAMKVKVWNQRVSCLPSCLLDLPWSEFESKYNCDVVAVVSAQPDPMAVVQSMREALALRNEAAAAEKDDREKGQTDPHNTSMEGDVDKPPVDQSTLGEQERVLVASGKENMECMPQAAPQASAQKTGRKGRKAKEPVVDDKPMTPAVEAVDATPGQAPFQLRTNMTTPATELQPGVEMPECGMIKITGTRMATPHIEAAPPQAKRVTTRRRKKADDDKASRDATPAGPSEMQDSSPAPCFPTGRWEDGRPCMILPMTGKIEIKWNGKQYIL